MLKGPAEFVPGSVDVGLDRTEGQVERGGDLLVRSPLYVTKHDARSILRTQLANRSLDSRAELLGLDLLEGRLAPPGNIERRGLDLRRTGGMRRAVHADRVQLPLSQMIDGDVVRD